EACAKLAASLSALVAEKKEKASARIALDKTRNEWRTKKSECDSYFGIAQRLAREVEGKTRMSEVELNVLSTLRKETEAKVAEAKAGAKGAQLSFSSAKSEMAVILNLEKLGNDRKERLAVLGTKAKALLGEISAEQLEKNVAGLKNEIETLSQKRAQALAESEALAEAVEALAGAGAKCPVCDSELEHGKSEKIAASKKEKAGAFAKEAERVGRAISEKKQEAASFEKKLSEAKLCLAQIERLASESSGEEELGRRKRIAKEKLDACEEGAKKGESAILALERELEKARQSHEEAARIVKMFSDYDSAREKLAIAQQGLAALSFGAPQ
ncbi:MAG: hypothetical protein NT051_02360, partial [Candidatus Micrarchaeota archaeon]|nr:hypothetical protein [Candidatus Micrarchaeota archaeon]